MRVIWTAIGVVLLLALSSFGAGWQITQLDNGQKVMILENHQVPQVSISTTVKVGAKNESDYFDGATHLLEHLILFRGTDYMTPEELSAAMKNHGAYFNGYTNTDWTDFVISLPKEYIDFALKIHSDMLFHSNFPSAEMDKERQAVDEEINISEDNPLGKAYRTSVITLYGKHPYSKNVLGTKQNVDNVPRDSVYAYYKRYYAPNNMTTVIVGDIDAAKTLELVKKYFADVPKGWEAQDRYVDPPQRSKVDTLEIKKDVNQGYLMLMSLGPKADSPDHYPLVLASAILGDGESSRLYKKLQDEQGLVTSISFGFNDYKYEGNLTAYATLDPARMSEVEAGINAVLEDVKKNGFTEAELQKAKNKVRTDFYASIERNLDYADRVAQYDSYIGYQFVEGYPQEIAKVTLAQLNEAARKYLNTDSYVKTMVVPK
ncbi:MAG: pitrilysin family protein [Candidatus Zixiibacteriota bacterium]